MSAPRWGDSSDDDEPMVDEPQHYPEVSTDVLNKSIPASEMIHVPEQSTLSTTDDAEEFSDHEVELEEETEEERQKRIAVAREAAEEKMKKNVKNSSIKDQLENLDDILNELGIDPNATKEVETTDQGAATSPSETASPSNKKKKPKKKKSNNASATNEGSENGAEVAAETETAPPAAAVSPTDVAAILKAKALSTNGTKKKSPGTASGSAAALAAAKEINEAKKALEAKKKKKSKKDQAQYGR
jgi:hypothetical protein